MAHPDQGFETLADLKGHPILISQDARTTFWEWLKAKYGFTDDQIRPYTFNPAPFLADTSAIQQGYLTSEPFAVEREGGFKPEVFLLADCRLRHLLDHDRDLLAAGRGESRSGAALRRCLDRGLVQLSVRRPGAGERADQGRQSGHDRRADRVLDRASSRSTASSIRGDARKLGIGAMTDERWRNFFQFAADAGLYPEDLDLSRAYTPAVRQQEGRHGAEGLAWRSRRRRAPALTTQPREPGGRFGGTGEEPDRRRRCLEQGSSSAVQSVGRRCALRSAFVAVTRQIALPTSSATSSAPLLVDRDADRPARAPRRLASRKPVSTSTGIARRLAVRERHEDHLVAAARLAVPRAVLADEHAAREARRAARCRRDEARPSDAVCGPSA